MEGRWGDDWAGRVSRYYVNGKVAATFIGEEVNYPKQFAFSNSALVIHFNGEPAIILTGKYTKEDAVAFYRISRNAEDANTGYRAILAYMKMRGGYE